MALCIVCAAHVGFCAVGGVHTHVVKLSNPSESLVSLLSHWLAGGNASGDVLRQEGLPVLGSPHQETLYNS